MNSTWIVHGGWSGVVFGDYRALPIFLVVLGFGCGWGRGWAVTTLQLQTPTSPNEFIVNIKRQLQKFISNFNLKLLLKALPSNYNSKLQLQTWTSNFNFRPQLPTSNLKLPISNFKLPTSNIKPQLQTLTSNFNFKFQLQLQTSTGGGGGGGPKSFSKTDPKINVLRGEVYYIVV